MAYGLKASSGHPLTQRFQIMKMNRGKSDSFELTWEVPQATLYVGASLIPLQY